MEGGWDREPEGGLERGWCWDNKKTEEKQMPVEGRIQRGGKRGGEKKGETWTTEWKSCGRPFDAGAKFVCVKDCVCLCVWWGQWLSDNPLVASWPVAVHIESTCSTARVTHTHTGWHTFCSNSVCVLAGRGVKMWSRILCLSQILQTCTGFIWLHLHFEKCVFCIYVSLNDDLINNCMAPSPTIQTKSHFSAGGQGQMAEVRRWHSWARSENSWAWTLRRQVSERLGFRQWKWSGTGEQSYLYEVD